MKQITEEQAIALIKANQNKELIGLDINDDVACFKMLMSENAKVYHSEASLSEPSSEEANRIGKLIDIIKPEIDRLGLTPKLFIIQVLMTEDATLMMDEMNALNDFFCAYEDVEAKWSLNTIQGEPYTVKMQMITVAE